MAKYEDKIPITARMKATVKKSAVFIRKVIGGLSFKAKDIFNGRKNYDIKYMLFLSITVQALKKHHLYWMV